MAAEVSRLKRRSEFLRVASAGRKWVAPGLILQARRWAAGERDGADAPAIRVGFTVSRKVGNAVTRNRVRRRLRAAVDQVIPDWAKGEYDFVVIGRAATLDRPFRALVDDLRRALHHVDACRRRRDGTTGAGTEAADAKR